MPVARFLSSQTGFTPARPSSCCLHQHSSIARDHRRPEARPGRLPRSRCSGAVATDRRTQRERAQRGTHSTIVIFRALSAAPASCCSRDHLARSLSRETRAARDEAPARRTCASTRCSAARCAAKPSTEKAPRKCFARSHATVRVALVSSRGARHLDRRRTFAVSAREARVSRRRRRGSAAKRRRSPDASRPATRLPVTTLPSLISLSSGARGSQPTVHVRWPRTSPPTLLDGLATRYDLKRCRRPGRCADSRC